MAASLWVRVLGSFCRPGAYQVKATKFDDLDGSPVKRRNPFRHTCPSCKVKLSKSNPFVYSVGEYVRGRRRNVVDHICRNCWVDTCRRSIRAGVNPGIQTHCQRPHWMDLPWVEPRLTAEETWLLDELCQFDIMPGFFSVVRVTVDGQHEETPYSSLPTAYVQTGERQFDEDEMRCHPVRDWCEDHGVVVEEDSRDVYVGMGECSLRHYVSFLLPRRDGQPHPTPERLTAGTRVFRVQ